MIIRILTAAAIAATALPALAQTHVFETHTEAGAAASGRSPHKAYRQIAAQDACGKQMHSLPGGKLPHYGTRQDPAACSTTLAARDAGPAAAAR